MAKTTKRGNPIPPLPADPEPDPVFPAPAHEPAPGVVADPEVEPAREALAPGQAAPVAVFSYDEIGRAIAEDGTRDLFIMIGGRRHEHVTETADGKWVYARS